MSGEVIPPGWSDRSLHEVVDSAVDGPFGSNLKTEHYVDEPGVRVVRLQNIGNGEFWEGDQAWVSRTHAVRLSRHEVRGGDVLVASLGDDNHPVARACLYPPLDPAGIVKADCFRLRLRPSEAVPGFVMRTLCCPITRRGLGALSQGVTRARVNLGNLLKFRLQIAPVSEQHRIATILDTLDETIRQTEQVIEKLKQMKQGLLHDLLTRGINDHGELRPPPAEAPHLYQDSPLGRIPRGWEATVLGELVPTADYGISEALADHGPIPVLRMMNLADGEADLADLKYSDSPKARTVLLRPGDVLFNRTNSIDHVGRTGIWRGQIDVASFASYLVRLVPQTGRLTAEFLNRWLNWSPTQIRIRRWATPGVHQVNINPTNLRGTAIAVPKAVEEQNRIASFLQGSDEKLNAARVELAKLRLLKQGLMDDLLTGRVRVPATP